MKPILLPWALTNRPRTGVNSKVGISKRFCRGDAHYLRDSGALAQRVTASGGPAHRDSRLGVRLLKLLQLVRINAVTLHVSDVIDRPADRHKPASKPELYHMLGVTV